MFLMFTRTNLSNKSVGFVGLGGLRDPLGMWPRSIQTPLYGVFDSLFFSYSRLAALVQDQRHVLAQPDLRNYPIKEEGKHLGRARAWVPWMHT